MDNDGLIGFLFLVGFFAFVFLVCWISPYKPKYKTKVASFKDVKIKKLKQELQNLEKK